MTGFCNECQNEETEGRKLSVCSRCKSRRHCSTECQRRHWQSFHKKECKDLARQRLEVEQKAAAAKIAEGVPAVMSTHNFFTGRSSTNSMRRSTTEAHQGANCRQSIASILDTMRKPHIVICACRIWFGEGLYGINSIPHSTIIVSGISRRRRNQFV